MITTAMDMDKAGTDTVKDMAADMEAMRVSSRHTFTIARFHSFLYFETVVQDDDHGSVVHVSLVNQ